MAELPSHIPIEPPRSPRPIAEFCSATCLFCNHTSTDLEGNYEHMQRCHGLFIPDSQHLIIDLESLLEYFHLMIFEYKECLYCHTGRRTVQGVQQHMTDTGHCKFDISEEDSEFRDFYDFDSDSAASDADEETGDNGETQCQVWGSNTSATPVQVDDTTMRLPSGKVVSNRSSPAPRHPSRRPLKPPASRHKPHIPITTVTDQPTASRPSGPGDQQPPSPEHQPSSKALEKQNRRATALAVQLAGLRANDQRALAHLSFSEQRAVLTQAMRQEAQSNRSERKFRGHMDSLGNLKSKERFVNDVPGGKSHKNRFFAQ